MLAKERSADSIKEALFDKRTVVLWNHTLLGRKAQLLPLLEASVSVDRVESGNNGRTRLFVRNTSSADLQVSNISKFSTTRSSGTFTLAAKSVTQVDIRMDEATGELRLEVLNALLAPGKPARITLPFTKP